MDTREIIRQAKAGTLEVPTEINVDPFSGLQVGDRVAYCSIGFMPSLPFIAHLPPDQGFAEWLKMADVGTIIALVTKPSTPDPFHPDVLTHSQIWATTATIQWDNQNIENPYIKTALLTKIPTNR